MTDNAPRTAEWVCFPGRPDLGHHPDPSRPTLTRCGLRLDDAETTERPRYVHTACLPLHSLAAPLTLDDESGMWERVEPRVQTVALSPNSPL